MSTIERPMTREAVSQAFDAGYHSEDLQGATHSVHDLTRDAAAIATALQPAEAVQTQMEASIRNALLYGVEVHPFEDADSTFGDFSLHGDTILLWTQGDHQAQVAKVRNLGWEAGLRNPRDRGNFIVYASQSKAELLPTMLDYAQQREVEQIFIADDTQKQLETAHDVIQKQQEGTYGGPRIHFVLVNRGEEVAELPEYMTQVHSLTEYREYVDTQRT